MKVVRGRDEVEAELLGPSRIGHRVASRFSGGRDVQPELHCAHRPFLRAATFVARRIAPHRLSPGARGQIRHDRRLSGVLAVIAISAAAQGIFVVLFVVFVIQALHGGPPEVGLLRGVQAVGALIGGMLLAPLGHRLSPRHLAAAGLLGFGLLDLAIWNGPSLTTQLGVYVVLFVVVGIPGIAGVTGLAAFVQANTPDQFRGRIFSAYFTVSDGFQALGMLLAGLLADPVGLLPVLNGQAVLYLLSGLLALRVLAQPRRRKERSLEPVRSRSR
jgi:MFS family permease